MKLFSRTLRSFNQKERAAGLLLLAIFLFSSFSVIFPSFSFLGSPQESAYSEALVGEITHLNPVFTEFSEADADVSSLIFSGLARYNAGTGEFEEDMATHTLSQDQLTYTFTLKNGVKWQDGKEVSSNDVYYTFAEVIQSPDFNNPILKANFDGVKIEKVNSRTVTFTLNSPNSFFFSGMTMGLLPEHILGDVEAKDLDTHEFNQSPLGTGPYQVDQAYEVHEDGSTSVQLSINPLYYGEKPSIEHLRLIAYPTLTDLVDKRSVWNGAARIHQSLVEEMDLSGLVTYQYELPQYIALFFNTDSPYLQKNKARLGLSKAIDKDAILKAIEYKVRIDTPLLELNQEEWIHNTDVKEAQGALFDAGWSLEEGARVRSNEEGETLELRLVRRDFSEDNPLQESTIKETAEEIQKQLSEVGVKVSIESHEGEEMERVIRERDYDLLLYGQSLGYNLDTFAYWHSSQVSETGLNLSNYQNPSADLGIEKIRGSFDPEEKTQLLENLAKTIAEDVPALFLYTPSYYYVVDTQITGIEFKKLLLPKDRFSNISSWKVN